MVTITLERNGKRTENPTIDQIVRQMRSAKRGRGEPELVLEYGQPGIRQPTLMLMVLFAPAGIEPAWNVSFGLSKGPWSLYLASRQTNKDVFLTRTRSGCVYRFRAECIVEDEMLVLEAVSWFLKEGTARPNLIWLDSEICTCDELELDGG